MVRVGCSAVHDFLTILQQPFTAAYKKTLFQVLTHEQIPADWRESVRRAPLTMNI